MATYRQLVVQDGKGWHLMSPTSPWEALRIAWMLWRHPTKVAVLIGVKDGYEIEHWMPLPAPPVAPNNQQTEGA